MSMGFTLQQELTLKHTTRLSAKLRAEVEQVLSLRLGMLVDVWREYRYEPRAICPGCSHPLTLTQIEAGFSDSPTNHAVKCPLCCSPFYAELVSKTKTGHIVAGHYYCKQQTLHEIREHSAKSPSDFEAKMKDIYLSALRHFGSLKTAFRQLGVKYDFTETPKWKEVAREFVGKLPDTVIAKELEVPARIIRRFRNSLGVSRFVKRDALES